MKRGDLITITMQGDFGKPRPALVIQSNRFVENATVTVLLLSSTLVDAPLFRVTLEPDDSNRLKKTSQVMIDKAMTINRNKIGEPFGFLNDKTMLKVNRSLSVFLGIAD
jgi:mRNA interferase MazF